MRPLGWILPCLWMAVAVHAATPPADPTCDARFDVDQGGSVDPRLGAIPRTVVVSGTAVEIDGWCRLDDVHRKSAKGGIRLRRRMKSCGPVRAGMFEAYLLNQCNRISVNVRAKRPRRRFFLSAVRHVPPSTFHTIE